MILDIGIAIFLVVFLFLGWHKGFMRSLVGFVAGLISFVMAILFARPIGNFLNRVINFYAWFDGAVDGGGRYIGIFFAGLFVYFGCRFAFWWLCKRILEIKEENRIVDQTDKIAGVALWFAKFLLALCMFFIVLHLLSVLPVIDRRVANLLDGSFLGTWLFDIVLRIVLPFIGSTVDAVTGRG